SGFHAAQRTRSGRTPRALAASRVRTVTRSPRARSSSARRRPTKPLPPVIRTFFTARIYHVPLAVRRRLYEELPVDLDTFKKLPRGGVDRRALVGALAKDGLRVATELLDRQRASIRPAGAAIAADAAVLILGGSNGITRALAAQLLFGERARVYGVHF